jgi:putative restriction endonuclease
VRNGLALCKTAHWLFDRGLVTLDDDLKIVQAKGLGPVYKLARRRQRRIAAI